MFELLLQADKSLADGALAQAERTYWQLVDLDPSNGIALAGLARVALARGDERRAREFADRALVLDPESVAALHVLETLEHGIESGVPDSHSEVMIAARSLETLGRRHKADGGRVRVAPGDVEDEIGGAPAVDEADVAAEVDATLDAAGEAPETTPSKAPPPQPGPGLVSDEPARGRARPDQMLPMPSEPLTERRQAGRLAAAAAAAAAATPVRTRHEPHHAMPVGRQYFESDPVTTPPPDEFARAEMAAAVEAVEALDDSAVDDVATSDLATSDVVGAQVPDPEGVAAPSELLPTLGDANRTADTLDAIEATEADESVAMRIALMSDVAEVDDAQGADDEAGGDWEDTEATEAELAEVAEAIAMRIALLKDVPRSEAQPAETDAAEAADDAEADQEAIDEFEAAEFLAGHQAAQEGRARAEAEAARRLRYARAADEEASEDEAEAQALREALEIVLGSEGGVAAATPAHVTSYVVPVGDVPAATVPVDEVPADEVPADPPVDGATAVDVQNPEVSAGKPAAEVPAEVGEVSYEAGAESDAPRKKGLFRRFRGK